MKLISHRGNISQRKPNSENKPKYIDEAITQGYDVEIDVWLHENGLYLGHDSPQTLIDISFLIERKPYIWVHCKNIGSLRVLIETNLTLFSHDKDEAVVTTNGFIWTYPGKPLTDRSICVLPELISPYSLDELKSCHGICSDIVSYFQNL